MYTLTEKVTDLSHKCNL